MDSFQILPTLEGRIDCPLKIYEMVRELDTSYVHLKIKEGIIIGTYKPGLEINLEVAKEIVRVRLTFTEHKSMPALINGQGVVSMDKEARDFFSSKHGIKGLKAAAIIVESPFSSFLGNFFLWVNKTRLPVKLFTNSSSALNWLKKFVS